MTLRGKTLSDCSPNALACPGDDIGAVSHNNAQSVSGQLPASATLTVFWPARICGAASPRVTA